jgi:hypothetical protein
MIQSQYGHLPVPLLCSVWIACMYFAFAAWILYRKMHNLYQLLLQNQKLNQEMKRLLQIFPESVIIRFMNENQPEKSPSESEKLCFTNHEFDSNICDVKNSIDALKKFKVEFVNDCPDASSTEAIQTNLYDFLNEQESKIQDSNILELSNVKIWEENQPQSIQGLLEYRSSDTLDCIIEPQVTLFNIKTLQVNWEGKENA